MWRYFVGGIAALLMAGAGIFLFRGSAAPEPVPPAPRIAQTGAAEEAAPQSVAEVPRADRSREEKRFDRNDKDKNGAVTLAEMQQPRRKAFAKLDKDGDGKLSFEEWTVRTSTKFAEADKDKSGGADPRGVRHHCAQAPRYRTALRLPCRGRQGAGRRGRRIAQAAPSHPAKASRARAVYMSLRSAFLVRPSIGGNRPKLTFIG